ncbi:hypothetical protein BJ508DRAFT_335373 [Ascobolus immersus RN42]|uniref:Uncharacterized protein n=1 Tax=Ascobolus immersus RN42 TaxID=1160509 RepID=A0A3N4HCP7_ASCIM|nr:hypothetical protein BJ508DRAFT_335373 [Ascobolus immersus RN42]
MRFSLPLLLLPTLALSQVLTSTTSTTSSSVASSTPGFNSPARVAQEDTGSDDASKKVPTLLDATGTPMDTDDAAAGEKIPGGNGNDGRSEGSKLGMSSVAALVVFAGAFVWI